MKSNNSHTVLEIFLVWISKNKPEFYKEFKRVLEEFCRDFKLNLVKEEKNG